MDEQGREGQNEGEQRQPGGREGRGAGNQGDRQGVRAREREQGQGGGQGMSISSLFVFPIILIEKREKKNEAFPELGEYRSTTDPEQSLGVVTWSPTPNSVSLQHLWKASLWT